MRDRSHGKVFDGVAGSYDRVRPGYPDALFEHLRSAVPDARRVLEVGAGTGKATVSLLRFGYSVLCIEPGPNLISRLKHNAPAAEVYPGTLEGWSAQASAFDLVFSASAFQWVDPEVGPAKVAKALKPGGWVALAWNSGIETEESEAFFQARQEVFRRVVPEMAVVSRDELKPDQMAQEVLPSFERTGLFRPFELTRYPFEEWYDTQSYIDLLDSYSPFRILDGDKREEVFEGIRRVIDERYGSRVKRQYSALLCLARTL